MCACVHARVRECAHAQMNFFLPMCVSERVPQYLKVKDPIVNTGQYQAEARDSVAISG